MLSLSTASEKRGQLVQPKSCRVTINSPTQKDVVSIGKEDFFLQHGCDDPVGGHGQGLHLGVSSDEALRLGADGWKMLEHLWQPGKTMQAWDIWDGHENDMG